MSKIDELIDVLAEHIIQMVNDKKKVLSNEIEKETKVLENICLNNSECPGCCGA